MTYRTYCGDPTPGGWPDTLRSYPSRLGDLDGRAVRLSYGSASSGSAADLSASAQQLDQSRHDAPNGQE